MEEILFYLTAGVVFMSLVGLLGGFVSYLFTCHSIAMWPPYHTPVWSQGGQPLVRHENCRTCEITVVNVESQVIFRSSLE